MNGGSDGWLWAGPHLAVAAEEADIPAFRVSYPPGEDVPPGIGISAMEKYAAIAGKLGLPTEIEADLYLMPTPER